MASVPEDELADLPSADLVAYLSNTCRRADFEAVARILAARDRRNAKLDAELAAALADLNAATARGREGTRVMAELEAVRTEIDALRDKYSALLGAFLPPRDEVEAAAPDAVHPGDSGVEEVEEDEVKGVAFIDLSSDEEEKARAAGGSKEEDEDSDDTESLSQRAKRIRRVNPGELEAGKVDVRGQSNSVGTLGNDLQKSSSLKIEVPVATTGKIVTKPAEDPKVVHKSPVVKAEIFDGEMPKTMLLPCQQLLVRSSTQEGSSKSDYCKAGTGNKGRSSGGVPARGVSQPLKGIEKMNNTPMAESSAKCGNKEVGAKKCASPSIPSEEPRKPRDVVPFEPCNESNTYVQVKRETSSLASAITSKWESEAHVFTSLFNEEVCMQAFCALYRQGKLPTVDKRVELRANKLAEFLLDGDLQGPMKRTVEELQKQDATNVLFLQKVTMDCSEQLYRIFRNKEDPYFF